MVGSLKRSPQTAVHSSCLLLDTGSESIGVAVPGVRFSVNLDERRTERMNHVSHKLVLKRNARILFFCFFVFFPAQLFSFSVFTSSSFEVEVCNHIYDFGA